MATSKDFPFMLGEDWIIDFAAKDGAGGDLDLTGAEVEFRLATATALLLELDTSDGVTIDADPTTGAALIAITGAKQTGAGVTGGRHYYNVRVVLADGTPSLQAYGTITASENLFSRFP